MAHPTTLLLELPRWLPAFTEMWNKPFASSEEKMAFVLELVRHNIEQKSGGPFAAAVFEQGSNRLIAAGVNLVTASNASLAHAEMVAIALAQQALGHYDLGSDPEHSYELITSCEPCAMCFGALPWSGIRHLVCGAQDGDARAIGFDEGPRHPDWITELKRRGISVEQNVLRNEAAALLERYAAQGGDIYNGRQGESQA